MKKILLTLTALLTITISASAMSYTAAREQALFLTDKMAYELNLTPEQYEAAYEINLDYLMGVTDYNDVFGTYWTRRNLDFGYILFDWQYKAYVAATYFYRPLYWGDGFWHFRIYARYPTRTYFFFDRPKVYVSYRGGHSWGRNGNRSYYQGRTFSKGKGMKDNWDGQGRTFNNSRNERQSSTRTTVNNSSRTFNNNNTSTGTGRTLNGNTTNSNRTVSSGTNNSNSRSFGNTSGTSRTTTVSTPTTGRTTTSNGSTGVSRSTGSTVTNRTTATPTRSTGTTQKSTTATPTRSFNSSSRSTVSSPTRSTGTVQRSGASGNSSRGGSSGSSRSFGNK